MIHHFTVVNFFKRNAFARTDTELSDIAAAANIGLSRGPPNKCSSPAAIGIPAVLYANAQKRFCLMLRMVFFRLQHDRIL